MRKFGASFRGAGYAFAIFALMLVGTVLAQLRSQSSGAVPSDLPPEAVRELGLGMEAANDKKWDVAVGYFNSARRIAPQAPEPLLDLGKVESDMVLEGHIPGRELRAICWFEAYLALAGRSSSAPEVRARIARLELKARENVDQLIGELQDFAVAMDFQKFREEEQSEIELFRRRNEPVTGPSSPTSPSPTVARWAAARWVNLVEERMNIPAFLDFRRTLKAAEDGRDPKPSYPRDPLSQSVSRELEAVLPPPSDAQRKQHHTNGLVAWVAYDFLRGLGDILNERDILWRFEPRLTGVPIKSILGPWNCIGGFGEGAVAVINDYDVARDVTGFVTNCHNILESQYFSWTLVDAREGKSSRVLFTLDSSLTPPVFSGGLVLKRLLIHSEAGYFDKSGGKVIDWNANWTDAGNFSPDGLAPVRAKPEDKWGYIDKSGGFVIPPEWDTAWGFSEGLAPVERGGKYGFIDHTGKVIVPPVWDGAWNFSEGLAQVRRQGKYGFIDHGGKVVIPFQYEGDWPIVSPHLQRCGSSAGCFWDVSYGSGYSEPGFSEGLAPVARGGKYGFIDKDGRVVLPLTWVRAGRFVGGYALVQDGGGKTRLVNRTGKIMTPDGFPAIIRRSESMIEATIDQSFAGNLHRAAGRVLIEVGQ